MSKEIKELDDKYLVIKIEDLEKYFSQFTCGIFTTEEEQKFMDSIPFKKVLTDVDIQRHQEGKKDNQYVVLNLDDEIDIIEIRKLLYNKDSMHENRVRDISIDLVNAILKAKDKQ